MKDPSKKAIGYFALRKGSTNMLCDGDALVIAGSQQLMTRYIVKLADDRLSNYQVKKTRYGEIMQGMQMGGVYTFDRVAFNKFLPRLQVEGKNIAEIKFADAPKPHDDAVRLIRVSWNEITF
jgi:hypothetical protein